MINNPGTMPDPQSKQNDYADEWIRFLKRRNAVLTVVWSLLLALSVGLLVVGLYFYQQQELEREKNIRIETQLQTAQTSVADWQLKHDSLQKQFMALQDERRNLEQMAGQNDSRLDLTSKMVDTLKQQIATLEAEKTSHIEALDKARELIRRQQEDAETASVSMQEELSKRDADFEARSSAYNAMVNRNREGLQEVDRMASQLNEKHKVIDRLTRERDTAQKDLLRARQSLDGLEADYEKLSREYKAMVSPVGPAAKTPASNSSKAQMPAGAFDPIVKPKSVSPQSKPSASGSAPAKDPGAFDYDEISIDQP